MLCAFSTIISSQLMTSKAAPPPPPPTDFTVTTSASYATLNFTESAGATSYVVTATPPASTGEVTVTRTFSSGSGYKLEVLSSNINYTFSLAAKNVGGTSSAVTTTGTTRYATVQSGPTITLSTISSYDASGQNLNAYVYVIFPKTTPNTVYAGFWNTGTFAAYPKIFYSQDGGVTGNFTTIGPKLQWSSGDSTQVNVADKTCSDLACSDDGKYVYVITASRYLNVSTNYGMTFSARTSTCINNTQNIGLSTTPTGEAVIMVGQAHSGNNYPATTNSNTIQWSGDANNTFSIKTQLTTGNNATAINAATNTVYFSIGTTLYYYNAGSKANLLSFNFNATTFSTVTMSTIVGIVSSGSLTFVLCGSSPKLYRSTDGITFTGVPAFTSSVAGTLANAANATFSGLGCWIIMEASVGFVMVCSKDNPARMFYSIDSGVGWTQLTSPTIPTVSTSEGSAACCVLQDTNVVVTIMVVSLIGTSNYRIKFYKLYFPVDVTTFKAVTTANPTISASYSALINMTNGAWGGDATVYRDRIYVGGYGGSSPDVSIYSISGEQITKPFLSNAGTNIVNVAIWNGYVYVSAENILRQFNANTREIVNSSFITLTGGTKYVHCVVFDQTYIYFTDQVAGKVIRMPSTGGTYNSATHDIITGLTNPIGVDIYEQYLYISCRGAGVTGDTGVVRYNKNTGETNLTFITGLTNSTYVKVYGEYIFVLQQNPGTMTLHKQDGTIVSKTYGASLSNPIGMDINDNRLYIGTVTPAAINLATLTHTAYEFRRLTTVTNPYYVYSDGNYVWFTDNVNNSIMRVQVSNTTYRNTLSVGTTPVFIMQANSLYWVANNGSNSISVITPAMDGTISVTSTLSVTNKPSWLASDTTSAWVAYSDVSNNLYKINLANTTTTSSYTLDNSVYGIISDGTYIYATVPSSGTVVVYQISSLSTTGSNTAYKTIAVGTTPTAIFYNTLYVYVTNTGTNTFSRITRSTVTGTPTVSSITVGSTPVSVYASDTYLWVLYNNNQVAQINVSDNSTAGTITLNGITSSYSLYSDGMYTWVTNSADTTASNVANVSQIVL
jgi:predicted aconitase with swiveling domain